MNTEFQNFTRGWHFQHIKSSPHHPQSNGLAERFVQTVKTTLIKAMTTEEDLHLALLVYRATPLSHNLPSPAELLNSRRYLAFLPTRALAERERGRETEKSLCSLSSQCKTTIKQQHKQSYKVSK